MYYDIFKALKIFLNFLPINDFFQKKASKSWILYKSFKDSKIFSKVQGLQFLWEIYFGKINPWAMLKITHVIRLFIWPAKMVTSKWLLGPYSVWVHPKSLILNKSRAILRSPWTIFDDHLINPRLYFGNTNSFEKL